MHAHIRGQHYHAVGMYVCVHMCLYVCTNVWRYVRMYVIVYVNAYAGALVALPLKRQLYFATEAFLSAP